MLPQADAAPACAAVDAADPWDRPDASLVNMDNGLLDVRTRMRIIFYERQAHPDEPGAVRLALRQVIMYAAILLTPETVRERLAARGAGSAAGSAGVLRQGGRQR